jgi:Cft2 family RNA processing exonuclease
MLDWQDDLKLSESDVYLDSRRGRATCFVSHAHADHLGPHEHAICTPATERLARRRTQLQRITPLTYFTEFPLDNRTVMTLLPAGHILGSAMLHVRRGEETIDALHR